jgi:hypothetical protein
VYLGRGLLHVRDAALYETNSRRLIRADSIVGEKKQVEGFGRKRRGRIV